MSEQQTETIDYPKPTFSHRAYGVDVSDFGEEGGMVAMGHVPDQRFLAACNHYARKRLGLANIHDDRTVSADDVLCDVIHVWAVPADPAQYGLGQWAVTWHGITEQTPGAIALTVLDP